MSRCHLVAVFALVLVLGLAGRGLAQPNQEGSGDEARPTLPSNWLESFTWRCIGPANMSGRITAFAVYEKEPSTWWAATASGGLLKTTNNGVSFEYQFGKEATVSIGDVQVAQSDPNIVWVGTGEHNPRNSASWGDGVYKSTDGGKTWKNMGLAGIYQTGRIAIHPTNADIVYVGALGRLWGSNEDRGLYKTTDGGKTWEKILYVDDKTGIIDLQMSPAEPDTLLVATYERKRDGFDGNDPSVKFGAGAAIYRTTDGGKTMTKVTGGLPKAKMGRIGLNYYRKDPNVVYAVIETEKIGQRPENAAFAGLTGENADVGARITQVTADGPAAKAELKVGDIVVKVDDKTVHTYDELNELVWKHKVGDKIKLEVSREQKSVNLELTFAKYPDETAGGRGRRGGQGARGEAASAAGQRGEGSGARGEGATAQESESAQPAAEGEARGGGGLAARGGAGGGRGGRGGGAGNPFTQNLGGQNPNLHERQGDEGYEYGGVYRSDDGGQNWIRINSLNPRPMYFSQVRVDPSDNKNLFVLGVELYKSEDGGKTFSTDNTGRPHADSHALWIDPKDGRHQILGGDGGIYVSWDRMVRWDHLNNVAIGQFYYVSVGSNRNYNVYGGLQDNSSWGGPSRSRTGNGPINSDWFQLGGGDGFLVVVDPQDKDQIYYESQNGAMGRLNLATGEGGNIRPTAPAGTTYRFNWKTPFILSSHNSKVFYSAGNYVFRSMFKGNNMRAISPEITTDPLGSASAMSESPVEEGVLYVGTTDGNLWATRNDGVEWVNVFSNPEGMAAPARGGRRGGRGARGARGTRGTAQGEVAAATGRGGEAAQGAQAGESAQGERGAQREDTQVGRPAIEDVVSGRWGGKFQGEQTPAEQAEFSFVLRMNQEGNVTGTFRRGTGVEGPISDGKYDPAERRVTFVTESGLGIEFNGTIAEQKMTGRFRIRNFDFAGDFTAQRQGDAPTPAPIAEAPAGKPLKELLPGPRWVSSLHASKFAPGRCYITLDAHRSNDEEPYVFVTTDYGRSWRSIRGNLPKTAGTTHVLREDIVNENVLYLGCEFSAWVSIDRGQSWTKFNNNLPTVAVHEFAIHPTAGEIVAATHGRSLWIADVTALRQMTAETLASDAHLYKPNSVVRWRRQPSRGSNGTRAFQADPPPNSAQIVYSLGRNANSVEVTVSTLLGDTLYRTTGEPEAGVHTVNWNLTRQVPGALAAAGGRGGVGRRGGARGAGAGARGGAVAAARGAGAAGGGGGGGRGGRGGGGPAIATGTYLVTLMVDGQSFKQELSVEVDPDLGPAVLTVEGVEWLEEMEREAEEEEMRERGGGEDEEEREREREEREREERDRGGNEFDRAPSQV